MIPHVLIVDDEEEVLESLTPGFVNDLARRLSGLVPLATPSQRINVRVTASGYTSRKLANYSQPEPTHLRVHLVCEKGGVFRNAQRLLRDHFVAVVVSDLRFSNDAVGMRAGKFFVEDVQRRNPETRCVLCSAYQKPDGFPDDQFVRKGSAGNLGGEALLEKIVAGVNQYLKLPTIKDLAKELNRRGLLFQSDEFGSILRRLYDLSQGSFGVEAPADGRRRPRPTVLIDGETGVGKTELAGLLHKISPRANQPFVSATCNQLTDEHFLRSILFGHLKGSFSGATADRPGLIKSAGAGVLLLDDLHKLPDSCSAILHSFLDDGEYSHLGEDEVRRQALAAIVATVEGPRWADVKAEAKLSESFINRVEQTVLRVPPLRSRPADISLQARAYAQAAGRTLGLEAELADGAIAWLVDFGFPVGNSRKLRDFVQGFVASHARVTDYLDVAELEEFAAETGLLGAAKPASVAVVAPVATSDSPGDGGKDRERDGWRERMVRLAAKALSDELSLPEGQALEQIPKAFQSHFPKIWAEMSALSQTLGAGKSFDIKLFDELLRLYAVYAHGSPAKAAKILGMKDNALREFVYSREQKRLGGDEPERTT